MCYVDWPVYIKRREYPNEVVLFVRNDGSLVCTNLCPYNYECPDRADREPHCVLKATQFEVPTAWNPPSWCSPRRAFFTWIEAVKLAMRLGEQLLKERAQQ